ncbi:DEAD/DEAH box helicase family protein [Dyadobacter sp. CY345]|uniref:type I restriction endonuclease subunit R n=1 Tax=Dyadobacter sp. CY345 TaxID=2909335 RepID=UPI001EEB845F|nr:type I restriction endonuclease [Dyadobacter sp. CY345]MCF2446212.1 DEAD/DEAH box helicase family protein [Dyadobacter sp. CY345]
MSDEYLYSELPAIQLFQRLGYQYLNGKESDERNDLSEVIFKKRLISSIRKLNPWIDDSNLFKAYDKITTVQGSSLMEINEQIWELIRGASFTLKQEFEGVEEFRTVSYIDYQNPENNDFLVVNQFRYLSRIGNHSIPDLVVYVNGIPIAILECKSPTATTAWDSAYSDLHAYQDLNERLFHYNQICAGIWKVGGRYGAISASQAFYSVFRTPKNEIVEGVTTEQDKLIYNLFQKEKLLDIIRHFVIFEKEEGRTIKKLPRYQQIRATNNTIKKLQEGKGGVVWHTQGSGKSITMAYVTRKLQAPEYGFNNPTVIIMTDRKDLDSQITTTFGNVGLKNVKHAGSVIHLDKLLRNDYGGIITTTIQKFQETNKEATTDEDQTELEEKENVRIEKHIQDKNLIKITKVLENGKWIEREREEVVLEELSQKENLYVLVDEAHRTHYGFLASFMRNALPHAKFIAFTGTPISKEDKSTLGEFYGGEYIDVYTIKESVADGSTVELLYDEGIAKLDIRKTELDAEFEAKFGHEPEEKKDKLKQVALKKYQFSKERVNDIAKHAITHFREKIFPNGHKALFVCDGRPAAIRYKQAFEALKESGFHNFDTKVIVSIGIPKSDHVAKEYYEAIEWNKTHKEDPKPIWIVAPEQVKTATENYKLPFGNENETEKSGKKKYDNTAILIVSDMLLTGYDAPIASCLYLEKPLREHTLLQAIARVNRSGKRKDAGYIMDYNGITNHLLEALKIFSGDIRPDDVLKNINEEFPQLELNHTKLVDFFKPLKVSKEYNRGKFMEEAVNYIDQPDKRDKFKDLLKQFNKSIGIVLPDTRAMVYFNDFKLYNEIKKMARNMYPDDDGFKVSKDESLLLQGLIDEHLKSSGVRNLLQEPISIIDREKFKEEILNVSPATKELKMRNHLKHTIKVNLDKNPDFYKPLAERLEQLIKEHEEGRLSQLSLLAEFEKIQDEIIQSHKESEQKGFVTEQQRAVYSSMKVIYQEDAEDATRTLFDLINGELNIVGWETKGMVINDIENKLVRYLKTKMERSDAKSKAKELVEVLRNNKNA